MEKKSGKKYFAVCKKIPFIYLMTLIYIYIYIYMEHYTMKIYIIMYYLLLNSTTLKLCNQK